MIESAKAAHIMNMLKTSFYGGLLVDLSFKGYNISFSGMYLLGICLYWQENVLSWRFYW